MIGSGKLIKKVNKFFKPKKKGSDGSEIFSKYNTEDGSQDYVYGQSGELNYPLGAHIDGLQQCGLDSDTSITDTPVSQTSYLSGILMEFPESPDTPDSPDSPVSPMSPDTPDSDSPGSSSSPSGTGTSAPGGQANDREKDLRSTASHANNSVMATPGGILNTMLQEFPHSPNSPEFPETASSSKTSDSSNKSGPIECKSNYNYINNNTSRNNSNSSGSSFGINRFHPYSPQDDSAAESDDNAYSLSYLKQKRTSGGIPNQKRQQHIPSYCMGSPRDEDYLSESSISMSNLDKGPIKAANSLTGSGLTASTAPLTDNSAYLSSGTNFSGTNFSISGTNFSGSNFSMLNMNGMSNAALSATESCGGSTARRRYSCESDDSMDHSERSTASAISLSGLHMSNIDSEPHSLFTELEDLDLLCLGIEESDSEFADEEMLFDNSENEKRRERIRVRREEREKQSDRSNRRLDTKRERSSRKLQKQRSSRKMDVKKDRSNRRSDLQKPSRRGLGGAGLARKVTNDSNYDNKKVDVKSEMLVTNKSNTTDAKSDLATVASSGTNEYADNNDVDDKSAGKKKKRIKQSYLHGKIDKIDRPVAEQLYKILNRYPLGDRCSNPKQSHDEEINQLMQDCPQICRVKYEFYGANCPIYPLTMLCAIGASVKTIKTCYDAHTKAIKNLDIYIGTALHYAIHYNNASTEVIGFLIDAYPKLTRIPNHFKRTPLHIACMLKHQQPQNLQQASPQKQQLQQKRDAQRLENISFLISKDKKQAKSLDKDDNMPLHLAASHRAPIDMILCLIEIFPLACVSKTKLGFTPLHIAIQSDASTDVVKAMIKAGPKALKQTDNAKQTPLHIAINVWAKLSTIKLLYRVYPDAVNRENAFGKTPLDVAKTKKNSQTIIKILSTQIQ